MFKRAYIIVFDKSEIDAVQLHNTIVSIHKEGIISNWWHHISTCYIIISERSVDDLSLKISNNLTKKKYLIVEIKLNNRQGWLTQEAWDWINNEKSTLS